MRQQTATRPTCENAPECSDCLLQQLSSGESSADDTAHCQHCAQTVADLQTQFQGIAQHLRHQSSGSDTNAGCERALAAVRALIDPGSQPTFLRSSRDVNADPKRGPEAAELDASLTGYVVHERIGRGGMGVVFRATQTDLDREVAIKILLSKSEQKKRELSARFSQEAQITARLDHPSIVPVYNIGFDTHGRCYYSMRLVRGREVKEVIRLAREDADDWNRSRAIEVLIKICQAMAFAHSRGVVHRDLKPANVMVGDLGEVYVMDWGLARLPGQGEVRDIRVRQAVAQKDCHDAKSSPLRDSDEPLMTMDGDIIGTPAYMPPEQARGRIDLVDQLSDVYSLGAILYQLLTGRAPYSSGKHRLTDWKLLRAVLDGPPESSARLDSSAPAELHAICEKAMARDRTKRYSSALEMAQDLQAFLDHRTVQAYRTGPLVEARKWVSRNPGAAFAACLAAVIFVTGLGAVAVIQSIANHDLSIAKGKTDVALLDAIEARNDADTQRQRAEESFDVARRQTYIAQMNLAGEALRDPNGIMRAVQLVEHWGDVPVAEDGRHAADPRGWDWYYLMSLAHRDLRTIALGHSGASASWSPDGKWLALGCGYSSRLHIFESSADSSGRIDVGGIRKVSTLRHTEGYHGYVRGCDWSPDGQLLATGCEDRTIRLWEAGTWNERLSLTCEKPVTSLRWQPGGRHYVTGHRSGSIHVRDAESGEIVMSVDNLISDIEDVTWSPNGSRLVAGLEDRTIILNAASGETIWTIPHKANAVAWFDNLLVLGRSDGIVAFVDTESRQILHQAHDHGVDIDKIRFNPNGSMVATGDDRGIIHVYDTTTFGRKFTISGHTNKLRALCWSPNGRIIASSGKDDTLKFWQATAHQQRLPSAKKTIDTIVWHPTDRMVAITARSRGVLLCDPKTREITTRINVAAQLAAWNTDGTKIALAETTRGDIVVWDFENQRESKRIRHGLHRLQKLTWGPRDHIAVSHASGLQVWHEETLQPVFSVNDGYRAACMVSPDGRRIATTTDRTLEIRNTNSWTCQSFKLENNTDGDALCWNPDSNQVAVATEFGIDIIDAATGQRVVTLSGHKGEVESLHWHPFEDRLVSGSKDRTVRIWDTQTGSELLTLTDHANEVNAVAWSPDGMSLASGGDDETAILNDLTDLHRKDR